MATSLPKPIKPIESMKALPKPIKPIENTKLKYELPKPIKPIRSMELKYELPKPIKLLENKIMQQTPTLVNDILSTKEAFDLTNALELWDQAGDRPYEVLQEEGVYDDFMKYLGSASYIIEKPLFRGSSRHAELKAGDILQYSYPTSWSLDKTAAARFIGEVNTPVIIILTSDKPIKGVKNYSNTYKEEEVIVYPIKVRVVNKYMENLNNINSLIKKDVTILKVTPYKGDDLGR